MESDLKYRRALFWDVPEGRIEGVLSDSHEWVIPRVFEYGTLADIDEVIKFYGADRTGTVLKSANLKPMARAMAFYFLGIDSEVKGDMLHRDKLEI